MDSLKRLQNKPSKAKGHYVFFVALFLTLVIAFVWSTTLPARFSKVGPEGNSDTEDEQHDETKTFTEILDNAKTQVGAIADWETEDDEEGVEIDTNNLDSLNIFDDSTAEDSIENEPETIHESVPFQEEQSLPEKDVITETEVEDDPVEDEPRTVLIEVKKSNPNDETDSENDSQ